MSSAEHGEGWFAKGRSDQTIAALSPAWDIKRVGVIPRLGDVSISGWIVRRHRCTRIPMVKWMAKDFLGLVPVSCAFHSLRQGKSLMCNQPAGGGIRGVCNA